MKHKGDKLPDFIIIGAMKSGTSSLHAILDEHPSVFIPSKEIYFFDVDDVTQHPDFFIKTRQGWTVHDFEKDFDKYFHWYCRFFEEAGQDMVIGEDTTTYLASELAPERIARVLPDVKLIAILRDPVSRAYSHYWHNVAAGRISVSFDRHLRTAGTVTLGRGGYKRQLERYQSFIDSGQLKVVLFEEFLSDKQGVVDEVCDYLGLPGTINVNQVSSKKNTATVPINIPARLFANRIYKQLASNTSNRNIPNMPGYRDVVPSKSNERLSNRIWDLYRQKLPSRKYPPMSPETRSYLEALYRRMNEGLSELINRDVSAHWSYMA